MSPDFDFEYFDAYTSGDDALQREVLNLFFAQIPGLLEKFGPEGASGGSSSDWQATAHAIKGSARGVGLKRIGDLCEAMEKQAEEAEAAKHTALTQLREALAAARASIAAQYAGIFEDK